MRTICTNLIRAVALFLTMGTVGCATPLFSPQAQIAQDIIMADKIDVVYVDKRGVASSATVTSWPKAFSFLGESISK